MSNPPHSGHGLDTLNTAFGEIWRNNNIEEKTHAQYGVSAILVLVLYTLREPLECDQTKYILQHSCSIVSEF